jgi:hypothetical protein
VGEVTIDTDSPDDAPAGSLGSLRRVGRLALWAGGLALVVSTVYLAVMAFLWHAQVGDLTGVSHDLKTQLASEEATFEDATADLAATRLGLEEALDSITDLADDKAQAQDYQYLLEGVALAMADCANESGELLGYVYDRHLYTTRSLLEYEADLRDYCGEISQELRIKAAEAEESVS